MKWVEDGGTIKKFIGFKAFWAYVRIDVWDVLRHTVGRILARFWGNLIGKLITREEWRCIVLGVNPSNRWRACDHRISRIVQTQETVYRFFAETWQCDEVPLKIEFLKFSESIGQSGMNWRQNKILPHKMHFLKILLLDFDTISSWHAVGRNFLIIVILYACLSVHTREFDFLVN